MPPRLSVLAAAGGLVALLVLPAHAADRVHVGPRGGSYAVKTGCVAGVVERCYRYVTAMGPAGRAYVAGRVVAVGPARVRSVRVVHGPGGPAVVRTTRWVR